MNVSWKVDGGETNLRKGSFGNTPETLSLSQRNDYYKALVFCLSQGCASATLYAVHVIALWPLGFTFMLTS